MNLTPTTPLILTDSGERRFLVYAPMPFDLLPLLKAKRLKGSDIALFLGLMSLAHFRDQYAEFATADLASVTGYGSRKVEVWLVEMAKLGLLRVEPVPGRRGQIRAHYCWKLDRRFDQAGGSKLPESARPCAAEPRKPRRSAPPCAAPDVSAPSAPPPPNPPAQAPAHIHAPALILEDSPQGERKKSVYVDAVGSTISEAKKLDPIPCEECKNCRIIEGSTGYFPAVVRETAKRHLASCSGWEKPEIVPPKPSPAPPLPGASSLAATAQAARDMAAAPVVEIDTARLGNLPMRGVFGALCGPQTSPAMARYAAGRLCREFDGGVETWRPFYLNTCNKLRAGTLSLNDVQVCYEIATEADSDSPGALFISEIKKRRNNEPDPHAQRVQRAGGQPPSEPPAPDSRRLGVSSTPRS